MQRHSSMSFSMKDCPHKVSGGLIVATVLLCWVPVVNVGLFLWLSLEWLVLVPRRRRDWLTMALASTNNGKDPLPEAFGNRLVSKGAKQKAWM